MKGLLVLLAVVAVASAGVPARSEKNIIDDILAVRECIEGVIESAQDQVAAVLQAIADFQAVINGLASDLQDCTALGDPLSIAGCIMDVTSGVQEKISAAILNIQQAAAGLLSLPDDLVECFSILG